MPAAPFILATLIGVFITPDGVVVGTDTSISNRAGRISARQKYCVTGPRTVATLQGVYYLEDTETRTTVALYDRFQELCADAGRTTPSASLRTQAERIATALQETLDAFLATVPAGDVIRTYALRPVVARVAVSGYDGAGAGSVVIGLGIATDAKSNRWEIQIRGLSRSTFAECGARFHGQEVVVEALRAGGPRIPAAERQKESVARLAAALKGGCALLSTVGAPGLFAEAARLTIGLGIQFGIPAGSVSLPLDVVTIPAAGPIRATRIESF